MLQEPIFNADYKSMLHDTTFDTTLLRQRSRTVCSVRRFLTQHFKFKQRFTADFLNIKNLQNVVATKCNVKSRPGLDVTKHRFLTQQFCVKNHL